ncbi:MAG: hypothetical protein IJZ39_10050 [Oscillospiraceae bacterium]|nr:hypothetical protein [Oscillospiraceae bacterium]
MKRIITIALALCMIFCAVGCTARDTTPETNPATDPTEPAAPAVNAGQLKPGAYTGSAAFSEGDFSMSWVFTVNFLEDGTFTLVNDAAEEKAAGTWMLTDTCYTMTCADDRSCTFTVQEDGTLEIAGALPYGSATIEADKVGGIILTYAGEAAAAGGEDDGEADAEASADAALTAGTYTASYTKESAMAGTVVYEYTAEIGADGTFSYSVSFDMGGTVYDGSAASGTYTAENGVFTFTDSEGNITEGAVTADNTLVISLMASQMAKEPYEVTFVPAA